MALIPLLLPVICILLSTICGAVGIQSVIIDFLSNKIIAMLPGMLAAYLISIKPLGKNMEKTSNDAVVSSGVVLLITGASGFFGSVIGATDFADLIAANFQSVGKSPLVLVLFAFTLAVIFWVALGSGTAASITTMNIMAGFAGLTTLHPVLGALACLAGGISVGHISNSGFWGANMSGCTVKGRLKSYTIAGGLSSW